MGKISYSFENTPFKAGQSKVFRSDNQSKITLDIKCFVDDPPPPGFMPCGECGSFELAKEEEKLITADLRTFKRGGRIVLTVSDRYGNEETICVVVFPKNSDSEGGGGGCKKASTGDKSKKDSHWIPKKSNIQPPPRPYI
ncbi:hypothetical protein Q4574_11130 [Aliiglaciecola sp. 3_MG-2023]|uniref:hypothetical protein n=1 Tax=Aliiglaciecola sp. 3_MG-2023 TaxID=3062644 RepID=UPI0026E27F75|nr:hypothetical protein [Aliiglaciecola sp. 3_MG-2023]MDO6693842.1 hypothetical protein [Aliiglaciecola sp. 3_MG-2023]